MLLAAGSHLSTQRIMPDGNTQDTEDAVPHLHHRQFPTNILLTMDMDLAT
jgi:hypothetical protein